MIETVTVCAYCDWRECHTIRSAADAACLQHAMSCEKHPLAKAQRRIAYLEAENARLSTTAAGWTYDDVMKQRRELETARLAEAAYAHESTTTIAKQAERIMQLEAWLKKACAGAAEILMAEISRVSYLEAALRWLRDGPGSKGLWADGERKQIAADALAGRWEEKKA